MALSSHERKNVNWFTRRMCKQLEANERKGRVEGLNYAYCMRRIKQELKELRQARSRFRGLPVEKRMTRAEKDKVIAEAADVANFLLMLALGVND